MLRGILGAVDLIDLALAILVVGTIYTTVDGLGKLGLLKGENGRKAIHISVGIWAATFPLFLNRTEIFIFHGMFFVGLVSLALASDFVRVHRELQRIPGVRILAHMFERYEDVKRWTIGHFLYPLSLLLVVLFFDDLAVYSFSVLIMALGDGFAAVIGKPFGRIIYFVPGGTKSVLGSFVFFSIALTLLSVYAILHVTPGAFTPVVVVAYAFFLTVAEGMAAYGLDNITVPILAAIFLNSL